MSGITLSASQTVGPFFHDGLLRADARRTQLVTPETAGERIRIAGHVCDGDGLGVPNAMLEIWQANHYGRYNHPSDQRDLPLDPAFYGFGRGATDAAGGYFFETIKPGRVPYKDGRLMAPHITVWIVARGINIGLHTRLYFGDEAAANAECPVLARIEHKVRLATLIAARGEENGMPTYTFDIHLQGDKETVFFDI